MEPHKSLARFLFYCGLDKHSKAGVDQSNNRTAEVDQKKKNQFSYSHQRFIRFKLRLIVLKSNLSQVLL